MSSNPAFLSQSKSPAAREREEREALAEERAYTAKTYYRAANTLIVGAIILVAIPRSILAPWFLHIIGGVACIVTSMALLMLANRAFWNGLLSLFFGWIILPGWLLSAPAVTNIAITQWQVIAKKWNESMGTRPPKTEDLSSPTKKTR